jgi:hypothetical protein
MVHSVTIVLESLPHPKKLCITLLVATYSTSIVDRAMGFYFFKDQGTRDRPRNWQVPEVLFLSTLHSA